MKHKGLLYSGVASIVVLLALVVVPFAQALSSPSVAVSAPVWTSTCDPVQGGAISVHMDFYMPDGYTLIQRWEWGTTDPSFPTTLRQDTFTNIYGITLISAFDYPIDVPPDGWTRYTAELYAPDSTLVSVGSANADCLTGETTTDTTTIYDQSYAPLLPSERVMGTVLYDTPLYTQAGGSALDATLTAGQTWFIVGQAQAPDGSWWYQVFVSSFTDPWVPVASMQPQGTVPGTE